MSAENILRAVPGSKCKKSIASTKHNDKAMKTALKHSNTALNAVIRRYTLYNSALLRRINALLRRINAVN